MVQYDPLSEGIVSESISRTAAGETSRRLADFADFPDFADFADFAEPFLLRVRRLAAALAVPRASSAATLSAFISNVSTLAGNFPSSRILRAPSPHTKAPNRSTHIRSVHAPFLSLARTTDSFMKANPDAACESAPPPAHDATRQS